MTTAERRILDMAKANGSTVGRSVGEAVGEILAGTEKKPARKKRNPDPRTGGRSSWSVTLVVPVRVMSEANERVHWAVRRRRFAKQAEAVSDAWSESPLTYPSPKCIWHALPVTITLTHVGRQMDTDNLEGAFKGVRDKIADIINLDDADGRVSWHYNQYPGKPGVRITIEPRS